VTFLVDTNIISERQRPRPDPAVLDWVAQAPRGSLHISVLVIGELRRGVEQLRRRDPKQALRLEAWLDEAVLEFGDRVVPISTEVVQIWGRLDVPDRLPVIDGLMAATALARDWTLVTRNVADVQRTGVRLLNPFST
jgi:predicted nucleic acid-binding protein